MKTRKPTERYLVEIVAPDGEALLLMETERAEFRDRCGVLLYEGPVKVSAVIEPSAPTLDDVIPGSRSWVATTDRDTFSALGPYATASVVMESGSMECRRVGPNTHHVWPACSEQPSPDERCQCGGRRWGEIFEDTAGGTTA